MSWRTAFIEHLGPGGFSGTSFGDWLRILCENRFAVDPQFWPRAALISGNCVLNSLVRAWETCRYGSAIAKATIRPPLFILGIWRSGTTHLHNLLAKDDRFAFPNTYQVLYPHTFLTTEPTGSRFMQWMMPPTRPMDNVKSGVGEPQEDEFALVASGLSFMLGLVIFPHSGVRYQKFLTLAGASAEDVARWKAALVFFLKKLSLKYDRPLILKSPAHTGRLNILHELFPEAKFVHIHRDPFAVFQSTLHTWRRVKGFWGLQSREVDEERVLQDYVQVYDAYFAYRDRLSAKNLCEVRFEDLNRDPLGQIRHIYDSLRLPQFDHFEPALQEYVRSLQGYSQNTFPPLTSPWRERVRRDWSRSFEEWGYDKQSIVT